jgi:alpha-tubulin suppressor-like RCC1 family protein
VGFGSNKWGQLMIDNTENIYSPKVIREEIKIASMACGEGHTMILLSIKFYCIFLCLILYNL